MSDMISEEDRNLQQQQSTQRPTLAETGGPTGMPVDVKVHEVETSFPEEEEVVEAPAAEEVQVEPPVDASTVLADLMADRQDSMLSVRTVSKINFCMDLFADDINDLLDSNSSITIGEDLYNVIQPLGKRNAKTGRIGLLTDVVRDTVNRVSAFDNISTSVVMPADRADEYVDRLLNAKIGEVYAEMYRRFEVDENGRPVLNFPETSFPLSEVFYATHTLRLDVNTNSSTTEVVATFGIYIHLRVPMVLRSSPEKVERNLIRHTQHLQRILERGGIEGNVYAVFRNREMFEPSVWDLLQVVHDLMPGATVFNRLDTQAYAPIEESNTVAFIGDFDEGALFNTGDFAFDLTASQDEEAEQDED